MSDIPWGAVEDLTIRGFSPVSVSFQATDAVQLERQLSDWSSGLADTSIAFGIDLKGCNAGGVWYLQNLVVTEDPPSDPLLQANLWTWRVFEGATAGAVDTQVNALIQELANDQSLNDPVIATIVNGASGDGSRFLCALAWVDTPVAPATVVALRRSRSVLRATRGAPEPA